MSDTSGYRTKTIGRAVAAAMTGSLLAIAGLGTASAAQQSPAQRVDGDSAAARTAERSRRDALRASRAALAPRIRQAAPPRQPRPQEPPEAPEAPEPLEAPEPPSPDMDEALGEAYRTAAEAFAKAMELRDEGALEDAAELFRQAYSMDPRFAQADAALYWEAYANLHTEELEHAREVLAELLKEFPTSQWIDDAQRLQVELSARLHNAEALERDFEESPDDEIKKAALMGLLHSNPDRAVELAGQIVGPGSKSTPGVRRHALLVLGMSGSPKAHTSLLQIAKADADVRMRRDALMALGHGKTVDEATFAALKQIALNEKEPRLVEAAIFAIAQRKDPRAKQLLIELVRSSQSPDVRRRAAMFMMHGEAGVSFDELSSLYDSVPDVGVRRSLIMAIRENKDPRAAAKLVSIARNQSENESVRRMAVLWIGEDRDKEKAAATLITLYDAEKDAGLKRHILLAIGQTRTKSSLRKLIEVAKSDADIQMRRQAVLWISESKDPEALQFLEELVK